MEQYLSTSEWGIDPRLYGKWYSVHETTHLVLGTIDYCLMVEYYNEDGTMHKHFQFGMKYFSFTDYIGGGEYALKWQTKGDEILIINEKLRKKAIMK